VIAAAVKSAALTCGLVASVVGFGAVEQRMLTQPEPEVEMFLIVDNYPLVTVPVIVPERQYKHGDCSWIPPIARSVGWSDHEMDQLLHIIARESGCCPRSVGGDRVFPNCEVRYVATWTHRSDTGLLQINGVHWKQDHPRYVGHVCKKMGVCTQEELRDPKTNLAAGRLLYNIAGWSPWAVPVVKKP
jgi:hypothetical protein